MVNDVTSSALHAAMRGLSARRNIQAQNIANVDTPGYLAGRVDFEGTLSRALEDVQRGRAGAAAPGAVRPEMQTSVEATRLNGNNVNLDNEIVSNTETELAYSTVLEALNAKFRMLRTSINGR